MALGLVCATLALFVNLRPVLEVANVFSLIWYMVVLFDALHVPKEQRLVGPAVSWFALAGCLALFVSLPVWALATACAALAVLTAGRWLLLRSRGRGQSALARHGHKS
jgi:hypothetical protein